jgi:Protein of unknown function (DUF2786)
METATEATPRDKYVDKVRGLLAKAQGTDNQAEAEAFFAKAQELITKWEIEDAELRAAQDAGTISWVINHRSYPLSSYSPVQDSYAMQQVAKAMGMEAFEKPYVRGFSKAETVVFGTDDDLDRFEMMWASVSLQMIRFMKAEERVEWNRNEQRKFRLGFKVGFGRRIGERIASSRSKATGKSLVLAGKQDALVAALPDNVRVRGIKSDAAANQAGARAADRADINHNERVAGGRAKASVTA